MLQLISNPTLYWDGKFHVLAPMLHPVAPMELSYHFGKYATFSVVLVSPIYPFLE